MKTKKPVFPELEAELAKNGMSYTDFGKILGITTMAISNRMNGKVEFQFHEIDKAIDYFNKDFKALFKKTIK